MAGTENIMPAGRTVDRAGHRLCDVVFNYAVAPQNATKYAETRGSPPIRNLRWKIRGSERRTRCLSRSRCTQEVTDEDRCPGKFGVRAGPDNGSFRRSSVHIDY